MCTACKEAKYELIFEGIWSRHTHPKDFPVDEWRTQFSKIIGASHSNPNPARNGRGQQRNRYRLKICLSITFKMYYIRSTH